MTACAGRGAQPIKFNGSLFTVGHDLPEGTSSTEKNHDPDYRSWGASFWNQNVRLSYWPLIKTGDYDLMQPWFDALQAPRKERVIYPDAGHRSLFERPAEFTALMDRVLAETRA